MNEAVSGAKFALYGTLAACSVTSIFQLFANERRKNAWANNNQTEYRQALRLQNVLYRVASCSRRNIAEGRYYTLMTSAWNHGGITHFVVNFVSLVNCGKIFMHIVLPHMFLTNMSRSTWNKTLPTSRQAAQSPGFWSGAAEFLILFYGGALAGDLLSLALDKRAKQSNTVYVGASGGICALSMAITCLVPWAISISKIGPVVLRLPCCLQTLGFSIFSIWAHTRKVQKEDRVAHLGHLGGLLWGLAWFRSRFHRWPVL